MPPATLLPPLRHAACLASRRARSFRRQARHNLLLLTNLVTISLLVWAVYFRWNDAATQVLGAGRGGGQAGQARPHTLGSSGSSSSSSDSDSSANPASNSASRGSGSSAAGASNAAGSTSDHGWGDPVAAAAAAGLKRAAPQLGERSARWAPFVVPACVEGMPRHWAPCRVGTPGEPAGLAYGEEWIYPDFSVPEPIFVAEEHREW